VSKQRLEEKTMRASLAAAAMLALTIGAALPAMAAGDVSAVLTGKGDLKIKGSNDSNQIIVTNNGSGNVRVAGMELSGTTVNGGSEWTFPETNSNTVPGKLDIDLGDGNNYLEIDDIKVLGDLKIKTRNGDDTIGIFDTDLFDDLSIKMGNGNNLAAIVDVTVVDKLDIKTGSGSDWIGIAVCVTNFGKAKLKTGSGSDKVLLEGTYTDKLKLDGGKGADQVFVNKHESVDDLNIKLGNDDDAIVVTSSATFAGAVKLNGGNGVDDQIEDPDAFFDPKSKSIENLIVDDAADAMPDAILAEMTVGYVGRGGDAADIACP
jgi:hypothetical protein